jgi:hypothetical protein
VVAYACASTFLGKAPEHLPSDFVFRLPSGDKLDLGTTASAEVSAPFRTTLQAQASVLLRDLAAVRSE